MEWPWNLIAFIVICTAPVAYVVSIAIHHDFIDTPRQQRKREQGKARQDYFAQFQQRPDE